jgi:D-beta-D-heptose 7-phosphate kinase/D-beta-D-heptose 1-phosphate adenosyltransferase
VISQRQQLLRMDFEDKLLSSENNDLLNQFQAHLHQAQLVILSDYHKGTLANPQAFIQLAREANVPVLVDPKGKDFSIYRGATIITPNLKEFEAVVGTCKSEHELIEKGRALLAQFQIENLLVTRGERGLTLIQPQETAHFPARAREVLDVTGAGDTVISALGAAVAAKLPLAHAAALANLAASIAVGKLGAVSVSAPELQAALNKNAGFTTGIINEEQLLEAVNQARIEGKKIVMTNGCFDILHAGHVVCLQLAKQMGDYLIVAVNTDESIQKLKGPSRPINHLNHRMTVLAGLNVVDWVVPFADDTPERLLRLLQPDVLVKGGDYQLHEVVGADIVRAYGGEVRVVDSQITSSSHIIKRIMTVHSLDDEKENRQHG